MAIATPAQIASQPYIVMQVPDANAIPHAIQPPPVSRLPQLNTAVY